MTKCIALVRIKNKQRHTGQIQMRLSNTKFFKLLLISLKLYLEHRKPQVLFCCNLRAVFNFYTLLTVRENLEVLNLFDCVFQHLFDVY